MFECALMNTRRKKRKGPIQLQNLYVNLRDLFTICENVVTHRLYRKKIKPIIIVRKENDQFRRVDFCMVGVGMLTARLFYAQILLPPCIGNNICLHSEPHAQTLRKSDADPA